MLDAMTEAPAFVLNGRLDILATNPLGRAPALGAVRRPGPAGRTTPGSSSSDPRAPTSTSTGSAPPTTPSPSCATEAGRDPYDSDLSDLVGELSTRSEEFRTRWAAHNVRIHRTGAKRFHHPVVGDLSLTYEMMDLPADSGLAIVAYTAEPGSKSAEALDLLASWTATLDEAEVAETPERA